MKSLVKKVLFCCSIIIFGIFLCIYKTPFKIQTDLSALINSPAYVNWPIQKLTSKFSSSINIIIESKNKQKTFDTASNLITNINTANLNTLSIQSNSLSLTNALNEFLTYKNSFLSKTDKNLITSNNTHQITLNAIQNITNSISPAIFSLQQDPFLLLSNYMFNLHKDNSKWTLSRGYLWQFKNDNYYILIPIDIVDSNNSDTYIQINNLMHITQELQKDNSVKIYTSGVPVHTAYMSQLSKIQLGILSFLSALTVIILNFLLFRKLSTILPVMISLAIGFLCGTMALFLCFDTPHILTLVFGTSLIGLGIDYSFHFLTCSATRKQTIIKRNIYHSFITTILCFIPLAFSSISLLQQIAVFIIIGLSSIYFGWKIFIPKHTTIQVKPLHLTKLPSKRQQHRIVSILITLIIVSLPFINFQNNISNLYKPNKQLLEADTLFQNLNEYTNPAFVLIRGTTLQEVLETEESIKVDQDMFSLSSVIPSIKTQQNAQELIQHLYKKESVSLKNSLELKNKPSFTATELLTYDKIQSNDIKNLLDKFIYTDTNYTYSVIPLNNQNIAIKNAHNTMVITPANLLTEYMTNCAHETYILLACCTLILFILLAILYRSKAILYLIPSLLGIGLTIGILSVFNQPITFFHLLSLFIVIGLGLDYTIFHINASTDKEIKPVLFSFLTSFIGFGLLSFTSFFLIKSMGLTLSLGLCLSYLISLYLFRSHKNDRT